jgi:hypothetical protein
MFARTLAAQLLCFALFMLFEIIHCFKHKNHEKGQKFAQIGTRLHLIQ